jgi:hypothetical protein
VTVAQHGAEQLLDRGALADHARGDAREERVDQPGGAAGGNGIRQRHVTIGVEETRVQRAFTGRATRCQFETKQAGTSMNVVATMDLQVDLGADIGLGDPAPAILVRATNASGMVDGVALDLAQRVFSFRLDRDRSIETLVDVTTLDSKLRGSVLLALRDDGTWSLRTQRGEWVCENAGSASCMLVSAAR